MKKTPIILGIDPGTKVTGYGVIQASQTIQVLDYGCICPPSKKKLSLRYLMIFEALEAIIEKFKPDAMAVETQFVQKNIQVAIKLGMARGMVVLAAAKKKIPLYEYAPKKAKLAVVGTGSASKLQVQKMVKILLGLSKLPEPEDAADALALSICHAHEYNTQRMLQNNV